LGLGWEDHDEGRTTRRVRTRRFDGFARTRWGRPVTAGKGEVQYLVLPDSTNPYLLARVRWPDVYQAISPVRPDWQDDPGLFDLPYDPSSTRVSFAEAALIAADWGAQLPADETVRTARVELMRRMPANWSDLSPAEQSAWSIVHTKPGKLSAAGDEVRRAPRRAPLGSRLARLRARKRDVEPAADPSELLHEELIPDLDLTEDVIDLTAMSDDYVSEADRS
jgi:hypothetical protein